MENKLKEYRAKKRREEFWNNLRNRFVNMMPFNSDHRDRGGDCNISIEHEVMDSRQTDTKPLIHQSPVLSRQQLESEEILSDSTSVDSEDLEEVTAPTTYTTYLIYFLYLLFWTTCYAIAIELQFGIVYFLLSALCGIYLNTRTGPKSKSEVSAYSVFNKDCHSIDGTLKGEQFDRELRYGPTYVR